MLGVKVHVRRGRLGRMAAIFWRWRGDGGGGARY
jgi:hypothetical protein